MQVHLDVDSQLVLGAQGVDVGTRRGIQYPPGNDVFEGADDQAYVLTSQVLLAFTEATISGEVVLPDLLEFDEVAIYCCPPLMRYGNGCPVDSSGAGVAPQSRLLKQAPVFRHTNPSAGLSGPGVETAAKAFPR